MGSLFHLVQTLPGMLAVVVGAVGGSIGALSALLLGVPPLGAITAAVVAFVIVVAAMSISNRRSVETVAPSLMPRFPSLRE